jgi:signal transduction histidine kinase/CheY-like chemotaxis protein
VFCSANPLPGPVNLGDRSYLQRAIATGRFTVGDLDVGRFSKRDRIGIALPVLDEEGEAVAVLFAALDPDTMASVAEGLPLPPGSKVLLVDEHGTVLGAHPPAAARAWRGKMVPWKDSWERLAARGSGIEDAIGHDGTSRLIGFATLGAGEDLSRLAVVVRVPTGFVEDAAWRTLWMTLLTLLVSAAFSLLAIWYFGELRIARRLAAMSAAADRLAQGDLAARTGVVHERDEIGVLAASFDGMAEHLEHEARERAALEDALRQSQKLEAVGRLAGGVAHDFNNLLTAILSYGRFLREDLPQDDERQEDVAEILKAGERAASLTKQLLAFSRKQPARPRVIDPGPLVAGAEKLLRRLLREDIDLGVTIAPDLPRVRVDPNQMEQVILNLVVNARDALPSGGRIDVDLGRRPGPRERVVLTVRDDGVGMDAEVKAHLFEPFFTTKDVGKGTGLGLAAVFGIVQAAGGTIEVDSEPGQGATFRVVLPAVEARPDEPTPVCPTPGPSGLGQTLLLVEDDDAVRSTCARALAGQGYRVLAASRASEALDVSRRESGPLALLISDVVMPGMSGPALARILCAERPELQVLLVTGHAERTGEGAVEFPVLEKPFTPDLLAARVHDLLAAA